MSESSNNTMLFAGIGCAAVALLGMCVLGGGAAIYVARSGSASSPPPPPPVGTVGGGGGGGGGGPVLGGGPQIGPGNPADVDWQGHPVVQIRATITRATSAYSMIAPGATCEFPVELRGVGDDGIARCHVVVVCAGLSVYGSDRFGHFPCTATDAPPSVSGSDPQTTSADQDGAFSIDTRAGTLTVRDDAIGTLGSLEIEARIDSVN